MRPVFLPGNLEELWRVLEREPAPRPYCGGTDLLVHLRSGKTDPAALVCLERIPELSGVREEEGGLWIGAATTHARLLDDPLVRARLPLLARALSTLGSPPVRNMGTIGGNVCTASPAGDTLPPLYALDGEVELRSRDSSRRMPLRRFITGPGETALRPDEILACVRVKPDGAYNVHHFEKIGIRRAMACSIASLAALLRVSPSGEVEAVRLAWGSVGPTVVASGEAEQALLGKRLSQDALEEAAARARKAVSPIDDARASAAYRREVSGNLLLRLMEYRPL
ncbi:MAG TPA: xanthine dehydrogenase family protein subunit M [Syntrophales bacterium]|nr:xanthine dehydrogenase family protein subunit M [Syntrophales bacterium]